MPGLGLSRPRWRRESRVAPGGQEGDQVGIAGVGLLRGEAGAFALALDGEAVDQDVVDAGPFTDAVSANRKGCRLRVAWRRPSAVPSQLVTPRAVARAAPRLGFGNAWTVLRQGSRLDERKSREERKGMKNWEWFQR